MDSINLNHANQLLSLNKHSTSSQKLVFEAANKPLELVDTDKVTLSAKAIELYSGELPTSRFESLEEQSANTQIRVNAWVSTDVLEGRAERVFLSPEDERLSHLSLKELIKESNALPNIDKNGHLQNGFAGTEQGDRIADAIANIHLKAQHTLDRATTNVSESLSDFKSYVESDLGVDPDSYTIKYQDGKATVISTNGDSLNRPELKAIQELLDDPDGVAEAKKLSLDIEAYNSAASEIMNNNLALITLSGAKNPYYAKELSIDNIMDGMDYSKVENSSHLYSKFLDVAADAGESYQKALDDGSHFDRIAKKAPDLFELGKMRKQQLGL